MVQEEKKDFHSWSHFKRMFQEHYYGALDEDEIYDKLKMRVQLNAESIDEYVDGFRQIAGRLKRPPSTSSQIDIVYKNLRREYRDYFRGHAINSFKQLLKLGRECEKENRIDERQSILTGKRTERLAEVTEKKESERAGENRGGKKGSKKKNRENMEVAAMAAGNKKQFNSQLAYGQSRAGGLSEEPLIRTTTGPNTSVPAAGQRQQQGNDYNSQESKWEFQVLYRLSRSKQSHRG